MRARVLTIGLIACVALAVQPRPLFLWNATASVPIGLYWLSEPTDLRPGDLVAVRPGARLAAVLAKAGWLPPGVPLLKPVAARSGQSVCRAQSVIAIDGHPVARALTHDAHGRGLPRWSGCRRLGAGEVFLLSSAPGSLDGRYFGPTDQHAILARARPLWTPPASAKP